MNPDHSPAPGEQATKIKSPKRFTWLTLITAASVFFVAGMGLSHGLTRTWRHHASVWRALAMDYKARYENELAQHAEGNADKWQGLAEEPAMPPLPAPDIESEPETPAPGVRTRGTFI